MYRNDTVAAHAHIDSLRSRVGALAGELAATQAARAEAEAELERMREGIGDDPDLPEDESYLRTQNALRLIGVVGLASFATGVGFLLSHRIAEPYLTWRGVQNLWFHIQYGDALTSLAIAGGIAVLLSPWLICPWLGAIGLHRQRRWGWVMATVAAVLYIPTPLMPFASYGLTVLFSDRVRLLYFPPR